MHTKTLKGLQIVISQLKLDIFGNLIGQLKIIFIVIDILCGLLLQNNFI